MLSSRGPTPLPRRSGGAPWAGLLVAFALLCAAPFASRAQESAAQPQPSDAVQKPKVESVPIAEVGVRAEKAKRSLAEMAAQLAPDEAVLSVEESLPDLTSRVEQQLERAREATDTPPPLSTLDELNLRWTSLREELNKQQAVLRQRGAAVEKGIEKIRGFAERWSATRQAALAADAPKPVLDQIGEVDAAVDRASERARVRQGAIVQLQSRVAQLQQTVDADVKRLDDVRHALMGQLFRAENPPIWSRDTFEVLSAKEIIARIAESQRRDLETIRRFWEARARSVTLHVLFLAAMIVAMLVVRRRVRRHAHDDAFSTVGVIFERPVSMALLLTILVSAWTLPQPRPLAQLVGMALLIPAVLILRNLLDRPVFPLLNALVVFWIVDRVRGLLSPLPHAPRLLFMLEMIGLIALMVWWMRPIRLIDIPREVARSTFFRVLGVSVRVVLLGASLALLAEASGYSALGNLIGEGVLFGAYAGVVLYGAVRVVDGLVAFALRVRPLRLLGMVQRHRWLIRTRTLRVVRLGAVVWWASETLERLEIADEIWAGMLATLAADIRIGEASVSIGDLVAFGVTIWATFQISRFVRFLLQEDVYTRVPLRKGMPYAVSTLAHYTILTLGFILAVLALGFDLNRFALVAGAFGVGIGFGLQNIVNNFVSGLVLLTERPVEVGDTVSLGDVFGEVQRIGIRSSTVRTWQGAEVIVPNGELVSEQVTNWTHSDRRRRLEIPVGVAYGSDPKRVMAVLLEVAKANPEILPEPEPYVLFMGFGESSLDFEVRAWTTQFDLFLRVRSELCVGFEESLRAAGIAIPFPQRDLHIRSITAAGADGSGQRAAQRQGDAPPPAPSQPLRPSAGSVPDGSPNAEGGE